MNPRTGERPATHPAIPHQQLSQNAPAAMQERLWERMAALPGVTAGGSGISLPDTRALHLAARQGPDQAFMIGAEFAHLHGVGDGSLHMMLPEATARHAIEQGWAEPHPLARTGQMPPTLVMVYGPRDDAELEAVWELVRISHSFATAHREEVSVSTEI